MKKRSKLIATLVASVMCLGLIVYGVYALTVSFALNSTFSFEANGVYVGVWGQVYTGATGTDLQPLTTDASYTYGEVKNFTAKEDGTPDGSKSQETISAWKPANVELDEIKPYLLYEVKFKNYAPYAITIIPNNTTSPGKNVTMREDKSALTNVAAGATVSYTISFEVTKFLEDIPQTPVTVNYTLRKATVDDIYVDENWFNITNDGQITGFNTTYYTDETAPEVLVIPETINGITVTAFAWSDTSSNYSSKSTVTTFAEGTLFAPDLGQGSDLNINIKTKKIIIKAKVTEIPQCCFRQCIALESVILPNTVQKIGERAFYMCDGLKSITIPSSVTNIANTAFDLCSSLKYIKMSGSTLNVAFTLPADAGKVWVTSISADMPTDWIKNVVTEITAGTATELYYHSQKGYSA